MVNNILPFHVFAELWHVTSCNQLAFVRQDRVTAHSRSTNVKVNQSLRKYLAIDCPTIFNTVIDNAIIIVIESHTALQHRIYQKLLLYHTCTNFPIDLVSWLFVFMLTLPTYEACFAELRNPRVHSDQAITVKHSTSPLCFSFWYNGLR